MKIIKLAAAGACLAFASFSGHAAVIYETTLSLVTPAANPDSIDTIIYEWSTNETTGDVRQEELIDLTMHLYSGGSLLYTGIQLLGGVAQDFGGSARTNGPANR